ncbi:(R)-2-hydroxyglutaryl-CoA dehydratase activator [Klebsiella pneumoniae]|uniref:(R)-2-hydroxyglutaryl-CoA dehydratase activator n=1 Tax=Klebsiella pneumoniae TaxID=573 RepID=A0A2X3EXA4_KLEPN|nr:(R)-2-hydroxyglutaryl-CoA dehydratase activator [Klebsiella pneumoniae]
MRRRHRPFSGSHFTHLGASVEQLDAITDGVEPHAITSMCTVFAESEVISLRSAGVAPEAILAGVINAMARRSANFIGRLSAQGPLLFTGGVSHCAAFAPDAGKPCRHGGDNPSRRPVCRAIGAALIGSASGGADDNVSVFISLHGGGGADAQSPAGGGSGLRGQRYTPPAAQRLRAVHPAGGDGSRCASWIVPEQTAALYQQNGEAWRCLATFPPAD